MKHAASRKMNFQPLMSHGILWEIVDSGDIFHLTEIELVPKTIAHLKSLIQPLLLISWKCMKGKASEKIELQRGNPFITSLKICRNTCDINV